MPEGSNGLSTLFLAPWWSIWMNMNTNMNMNTSSGMDHALGFAATMGVSLAIMKVMTQTIKSTIMNKTDGDDSTKKRQKQQIMATRGNISYNSDNNIDDRSSTTFYVQLRGLIRAFLLKEKRKTKSFTTKNQNNRSDVDDDDMDMDIDDDSDDDSDDDGLQEVKYYGSCHCQSVEFELIASKCLHANKGGTGKINYPHIRIPAVDFRFNKGEELLHMYYVAVPPSPLPSPSVQQQQQPHHHQSEPPVKAAHSFCSQCGVHLLHAPDASSSLLDVNLDCFQSFHRVKYNNNHKKSKQQQQQQQPSDSLSSRGVPIQEQWKHGAPAAGTGAAITNTITANHNNTTPIITIQEEGGPANMNINSNTNNLHHNTEASFDQLTVITDDPTQAYYDPKEEEESVSLGSSYHRHRHNHWKSPRAVMSSSYSVPGTFGGTHHHHMSPGTPATTVTTSTESLSVYGPSTTTTTRRSAAIMNHDGSFRLKAPPNSTTSRSSNIINGGGSSNSSISSSAPTSNATTPTNTAASAAASSTGGTPIMMRDQLKYYMSKHILSNNSNNNNNKQSPFGNNKSNDNERVVNQVSTTTAEAVN